MSAPHPALAGTAAILHVGAPKCGSSALQAALSAHPDLRGEGGLRYRYTARPDRGVISGVRLRLAARASVFGYAAWRHPRAGEEAAFWDDFAATLAEGARRGHVPILSHEGWLEQAATFAPHLAARAGGPPVGVVAFLRPPVDWLNAGWWQWGVWTGLDFGSWLARPGGFALGRQIAAWAALPGVRLVVRPAGGDVVAGFAGLLGAALPGGAVRNAAASPALAGFLLRNRRFRPGPHDAQAEFVVQRWCRLPAGPRLWTIGPQHLDRLAATLPEEIDRLCAALAPEEAAALMADPRWSDPLAAALPAPSVLDDPADLAALDDALRAGLAAACAAAGRGLPVLPPAPGADAPVARQDAVLAQVLDALLQADAAVRLGRVGQALQRWRPRPPADPDPAAARITLLAGETMHSYRDALVSGPDTHALARAFPGGLRFTGPAPLLDRPLLIVAAAPGGRAADLGRFLQTAGLAAAVEVLPPPADLAADLAADPGADPPADFPSWLAARLSAGDAGGKAPPAGRPVLLACGWQMLGVLLRADVPAMAPATYLVHLRHEDAVLQAALDVLSAAAGTEPSYDPDAIARALSAVRAGNDMIALLSAVRGIGALDLAWEHLARRPALHLERLALFCGLAAGARPPPVPRADPRAPARAAAFRAQLRETLFGPPQF